MRETYSAVTWSEVEADDVVLLPLDDLVEPVPARVVSVEKDDVFGPGQGPVYAHIEASGQSFPRWRFASDRVAYVKARF
jgi:hypothetical protein